MSKREVDVPERGMSRKKMVELVVRYRKYLLDADIGKSPWSGQVPPDTTAVLPHLHTVLEEIEWLLAAKDDVGATGRIGFIQGCLWALGVFTLDELNEHNRP